MFLPAVFLLAGCCLAAPAALAAEPTENDVKVAYLFNFAQFVDWPSGAGAGADDAVNFCVIGGNPFGRTLYSIQGKTIKNRKVAVSLINAAAEASQCQVLFISRSERQQVRHITGQLGRKPVLTISDTEDFVQAGGMIGMFLDDGRVQFEINNAAAEHAGLKISSHLLRLAKKGPRHD